MLSPAIQREACVMVAERVHPVLTGRPDYHLGEARASRRSGSRYCGQGRGPAPVMINGKVVGVPSSAPSLCDGTKHIVHCVLPSSMVVGLGVGTGHGTDRRRGPSFVPRFRHAPSVIPRQPDSLASRLAHRVR
jgi:hypothetical protein